MEKIGLNDYEKKHNRILREMGAECTVLLKKDGRFPLKEPGRIALYGSGARHTIKGGTGSGEVNSRFFVTVEEGIRDAGFQITSSEWLDGYDHVRIKAKEQFIKDIKAEAKAKHTQAVMIGMGRSMPEPEYRLPLDGEGDTAVYILSRISGEGSDREAVPGEIMLSQTEKRDILACSRKYRNFMLVLNVGGVVDLTEVRDVGNILILSQLGVETGNILADILLGKSVPSGKLTTTWSAWEDYPAIGEFGNKNDTRYKEGVYVGYRYFDSVGKKPLFPFGYGLSYTDFTFRKTCLSISGTQIVVKASVRNAGKCKGKEVLQLYISIPKGRQRHPYQMLAGFGKTRELAPGEEQELCISFDMTEIAPYSTELEAWYLEQGDYVLRLGAGSADTEAVGIVHILRELIVKKVRNAFGKPDFEDYVPDENSAMAETAREQTEEHSRQPEVLCLDETAVTVTGTDYGVEWKIDPAVRALSDEQLVKLNMGAFNPKSGVASMIGNAGFTVAGAAGQTSLEAAAYGIPSLVMADGPAGLRLSREYVRDEKGVHSLGMPFPESLLDFLPGIAAWIVKRQGYRPKKKASIQEQYATAIPIGTAIAQSFNLDFAEKCGDIVGDEMERFGVHLWLAPALNIHRSIRCGRNFEYYSEDPKVSGEFAAAMTLGVQKHPGRGTTIKHFAANNQELNRTQNNSQVSERAMREIYLKGFEIAVKKSQPKAVMTSYNLVNGIHTAEHRGLIEDVLRCEFGYRGLVMTDWTINGYSSDKDSMYPVANPVGVANAGGDLFMPGGKKDYDVLMQALQEGKASRQQLEINGTRVVRMAKELSRK